MPMNHFFEAWAETVFRLVAQRTGAQVKVGRSRETVHAMDWEPAYGFAKGTRARHLAGGRLIHQATLGTGSRQVRLWLTAVPMATPAERIATIFSEKLRQAMAA
jgi:hypothetical protein